MSVLYHGREYVLYGQIYTEWQKSYTAAGSDKYHLCSAFIQIFVNIPIVANHVCLKYLEHLGFVPVVVWCQLRIPESPSRPELELNTMEDG